MIGFKYPIKEHVGKKYCDANASRWKLKIEPFVV
jgi:hypothetical protein